MIICLLFVITFILSCHGSLYNDVCSGLSAAYSELGAEKEPGPRVGGEAIAAFADTFFKHTVDESQVSTFLRLLKTVASNSLLTIKRDPRSGLRAHLTMPIDRGLVVHSISLEHCITADPLLVDVCMKPIRSPALVKLVEGKQVLITGVHFALMLTLLKEILNPRTPFIKAWIDLLPRDYSHMPQHYPPVDRESLKSTSLDYLMRDNVDLEVAGILHDNAVQEGWFQAVPKKLLHWAYLTVLSRSYMAHSSSVAKLYLLPGFDFVNAVQPERSNVSVLFDLTSEHVHYRSEGVLNPQEGLELMTSYGNLLAPNYLFTYGYLMMDDKNSYAPLPVGLDFPEAVEAGLGIRDRAAVSRVVLKLALFDTSVLNDVFSVLRPWCASGQQYEFVKLLAETTADAPQRGFDSYRFVAPLSIVNEHTVMMRVWELCNKQLRRYATTYEEDENLLQSPRSILSANTVNIVKLRMQEKRILRVYARIGLAVEHFRTIKRSQYTAGLPALLAQAQDEPSIGRYIQEVWTPLFRRFGDRTNEEVEAIYAAKVKWLKRRTDPAIP
jgi:hypothetical protein